MADPQQSGKDAFIEEMAAAGQYAATYYDYPLPAMIACACAESAYGTSHIYQVTRNPFNIQKPSPEFSKEYHMPRYEWPHCLTLTQSTESKVGAKAAPAPFCIADDLVDAARQFCEWIAGYPARGRRDALLRTRRNAVAFANGLYLVGFADNKAERTKEYGVIVVSRKLRERFSVSPGEVAL